MTASGNAAAGHDVTQSDRVQEEHSPSTAEVRVSRHLVLFRRPDPRYGPGRRRSLLRDGATPRRAKVRGGDEGTELRDVVRAPNPVWPDYL